MIIRILDFFKKNKWFVLAVILLIFISFFYHNKMYSLHFVDEEDNFVLGYYLFFGEKIYSDLFSHHQPLGYIISAVIQLVTQPDTILELIKRHREFVIGWSLLWGGLLLWRFRQKVFIPLIIFEISKVYLLGNLFLSESLAVYPVLYLILLLLEEKKEKVNNYELLLIGLLIGFAAFILAPLWPFLFVYLLFFIWLKKIRIKEFGFIILGGIPSLLICLPFVDIYYYFYNVFYINYVYYIPLGHDEKQPMAFIKGLLSPVTTLILPIQNITDSIGFIMKIISLFFFASVVYLLKLRKFRVLAIIIILLGLANIRYVVPGQDYYRGFHILIWYGIFIFVSFIFLTNAISKIKTTLSKRLLYIPFFIGISLIIYSSHSLFILDDKAEQYHINYSRQQTFGTVINIMKNDEDTLFVIPDEWLLYWEGKVKHANKMVNFYPWMSKTPDLNNIVVDDFNNNPPTFFYCDCEPKVVMSYSGKYIPIIKDENRTSLWVLKAKLETLDNLQLDKLKFHNIRFNL